MARALNEPRSVERSWTRRLERFSGWLEGEAVGALLLGAIAGGTLGSVLLWLWPAEQGWLGGYAEAFRRWCLGRSGDGTASVEVGSVASLFAVPLVLAGAAWSLWGEELRAACRARASRLVRAGVLGALLAAGSMGGALFLVQPPAREAQRLMEVLRTDLPIPVFRLLDQRGETTGPEVFEGRVTVLSAVYARCRLTCPLIVHELQQVLARVPRADRRRLRMVLLTFDPAHDTPEVLSEMAVRHRVAAPTWRLLTGEPERVNRLLDRLGFERTVLGDGQISHANLFLVVGPKGRVRWRFALGQADLLASAVLRLLRETSSEVSRPSASR